MEEEDSNKRDPQFWRDLAEETRAMARKLTDPEAIGAMLRVADEYEQLAELSKPAAEEHGEPKS